jgi:mRNA interferase MazF
VTSEAVWSAGDVVVVPFPYADRLPEKKRPALVVSSGQVHVAGLVWLAMIMSSTHSRLPGDVLIEDLAATGLSTPCIVRTMKIACIDVDRVIRRSGRLGERVCARVSKEMLLHQGLT